ncbi:hypothetical protein, partial [Niallia taxi]|uniref:hypothetical protein n=1 Tax=Niallia taxi TaxID=2499688 RepID=UPI00300975B9
MNGNIQTTYIEGKPELTTENKLYELLILREFFINSLISTDFKPVSIFGDSIVLTQKGEQIALTLLSYGDQLTVSEYKLAIFSIFYENEYLIDIEKTDLTKLKGAFSNEMLNGHIRYPWIYERNLYDRFFDNFESRPKKLDLNDTNLLLNGTPKGVFQLGKLLVGPYGLIESKDIRYLPVTKKAPLWHCRNLTCNALHFVELASEFEKTKIGQLLNFLKKTELPKKIEKIVYKKSMELERYDYNLSEVPFVLINAFSETELKILLEKLISQNSYFWEISPLNSRAISPKKIADNVSISECFQLILLFKNTDIIACLEMLIQNDEIKIPFSEIRDSYFGFRSSNTIPTKCQVSPLGLRIISKNKGLASLRLKHLILAIYKDLEELDWKLRLVEGKNLNDKLENLLMNENPRQIVKDYFLSSPKHIKFTMNYLLINQLDTPTDNKQEEYLINKILWKLGFNITAFPDYLQKFWDRLNDFEEVSTSIHPYNEDEKEKIRSSAVNLFVSVEELLDASLTFITWVLLSDHYGETKYKFNLDNSRVFMSTELSGKKQTESGPIMFDSKGKNTLFPLIQGFTILSDYLDALRINGEKYKRVEHDIPDYINKTDLYIFPFHHTKLVLDLSDQVYNNITSLLKKITVLFDKKKVANVRNKLEHKRIDFPTYDEIKDACLALKEVGSLLEENGICPVVYQFNETCTDTFGRGYN